MKSALILLLIALVSQLNASEKDETQGIAKGIQCSYLREKSFLNIYETYSIDKSNAEYIKKVSDAIYSQAFKICDPENTANADKEILSVCTSGCDQSATKGLLGIGGPSSDDIEKCKKLCQNYSDHLSNNYTGATKALKKYIELNPPKKIEAPAQVQTSATTTPPVSAPANTSALTEKEKEKKE